MSDKPAIILVNPQMGENIGAAARAMFNFSLTDLRLVSPRDGWPNVEAERNASGALEQGCVHVQVFDNFEDSIADLHYVLATTARPRDLVKDVYAPSKAVMHANAKASKTGLVFGGERAGLSNDHIALCNAIITFPTNPDFSSLNLGQSVLLCAWEWFRAQDHAKPHRDNLPAEKEKLHEFLNRLENELDHADFFKSEGLKPTMIRNIRAMFTRAELTDQEVRTLQGILSAFTK
ncbi:MAG: RNA methyltransferase [Alphaproteobacteria bacterium]